MRSPTLLAAVLVLSALADPASAAATRFLDSWSQTAPAPPPPGAAPLRYMSWPGKAAQPATPAPAAATAVPRAPASAGPGGLRGAYTSAVGPYGPPAPPLPASIYAAPAPPTARPALAAPRPARAVPVEQAAASPTRPIPPPSPLMAAAPAQALTATPAQPAAQARATPSVQAIAQADGELPPGPRFYSLHRAYGVRPDPIPLPEEFFGATPDLAKPPPLPPRAQTNANGQVIRPPPPNPDTSDPTAP